MSKETLKARVEAVLRDLPDTRNDDTLLALNVWHRMRPDLFEKVEGKEGLYIRAKDLLDYLPNHDHISRIRRKFQEDKKYPATDPEVIRQRSNERKKWEGFAQTGSFE